jgi:maleate isomerase
MQVSRRDGSGPIGEVAMNGTGAKTARVGLIVPSSNTVVETDFFRELPSDVSLHTARMFLGETTAESERIMVREYVPRAVADIASIRPDVVAFACTSAGAVLGAEGERQLIENIARETGATVVSTNDAVGACIGRHNPSSVAVITPYIEELNVAIRAGLEKRGLRVASISGLGLTDNLDIGAVSPRQILELAERELVGLEFDLLFVSCTNFRAFEAREALSARFGVPVVTSNQATFDAVTEAIGRSTAHVG